MQEGAVLPGNGPFAEAAPVLRGPCCLRRFPLKQAEVRRVRRAAAASSRRVRPALAALRPALRLGSAGPRVVASVPGARSLAPRLLWARGVPAGAVLHLQTYPIPGRRPPPSAQAWVIPGRSVAGPYPGRKKTVQPPAPAASRLPERRRKDPTVAAPGRTVNLCYGVRDGGETCSQWLRFTEGVGQ